MNKSNEYRSDELTTKLSESDDKPASKLESPVKSRPEQGFFYGMNKQYHEPKQGFFVGFYDETDKKPEPKVRQGFFYGMYDECDEESSSPPKQGFFIGM